MTKWALGPGRARHFRPAILTLAAGYGHEPHEAACSSVESPRRAGSRSSMKMLTTERTRDLGSQAFVPRFVAAAASRRDRLRWFGRRTATRLPDALRGVLIGALGLSATTPDVVGQAARLPLGLAAPRRRSGARADRTPGATRPKRQQTHADAKLF